MAKNLKDRICEGLEDQEGHIIPVIRHLMYEAWEEGAEAAIERLHTYGREEKAKFSNPYISAEEQHNDGTTEAVWPR
jgi:hypothetical protein